MVGKELAHLFARLEVADKGKKREQERQEAAFVLRPSILSRVAAAATTTTSDTTAVSSARPPIQMPGTRSSSLSSSPTRG